MGITTVSFSSKGKNYISYQDSLGYTLILDEYGLVAEELEPGEKLETNSKIFKGEVVEVKPTIYKQIANKFKANEDDKKYINVKIEPCHKGLSKAFTWEGINFYAGGWKDEKAEIVGKIPTSLLIDLDNNVSEIIKTYGLSKKSKLKLNCYEELKCIKISWPDYGVPFLGVDFWENLIEVIKTEGRDVVVFCYGGHGRTGTFLSILAGLLKLSDDPVAFVRSNHCEKAVEGWKQIDYIEEITGLKVTQKPAKDFGVSGNIGYGNWNY